MLKWVYFYTVNVLYFKSGNILIGNIFLKNRQYIFKFFFSTFKIILSTVLVENNLDITLLKCQIRKIYHNMYLIDFFSLFYFNLFEIYHFYDKADRHLLTF